MIRSMIALMILNALVVSAQTPINALESTIKIAGMGEETIYPGFAEGDQKIQVYQTAIYKFRFANTAIGGRICKILIQRVPGSTATTVFNTNVYWRTLNDTSYAPIAERYLVKADTIITTAVDQVTKVSSRSALNGNLNTSVVDIDLPEGTVVWSYYLGAGHEGKKAYDDATNEFTKTVAQTASKVEGYGTMAALAIYGLNLFAQAQGQDNVKYWIIPDWNNVVLFQSRQMFQTHKTGDVINDASRITFPIRNVTKMNKRNEPNRS